VLRIKRILVPCDFSPFSDAAASQACELAKKFDAELHLLDVVAPPAVLAWFNPACRGAISGECRISGR